MGAAPIGAVIGGFVTQATDVRVANLLASAITVVSWLLLLAALRHLDDALAVSPATT